MKEIVEDIGISIWSILVVFLLFIILFTTPACGEHVKPKTKLTYGEYIVDSKLIQQVCSIKGGFLFKNNWNIQKETLTINTVELFKVQGNKTQRVYRLEVEGNDNGCEYSSTLNVSIHAVSSNAIGGMAEITATDTCFTYDCKLMWSLDGYLKESIQNGEEE